MFESEPKTEAFEPGTFSGCCSVIMIPIVFVIVVLLSANVFAQPGQDWLIDGPPQIKVEPEPQNKITESHDPTIGPRLNSVETKVANLQKQVDRHESRLTDLESRPVATSEASPAYLVPNQQPVQDVSPTVNTDPIISVTYGPPVVTSQVAQPYRQTFRYTQPTRYVQQSTPVYGQRVYSQPAQFVRSPIINRPIINRPVQSTSSIVRLLHRHKRQPYLLVKH